MFKRCLNGDDRGSISVIEFTFAEGEAGIKSENDYNYNTESKFVKHEKLYFWLVFGRENKA